MRWAYGDLYMSKKSQLLGSGHRDKAETLLGSPRLSQVSGTPAPTFTPSGAGASPGMDSAYDGSSQINRDVALWSPSFNSADGDLLGSKPLLDARVRDTIRNDAYVQGGADLHQDNIVGAMFALNAKPDFKILGLDEDWADAFQEEVESKFTLWAESPNNWPDASRINTFTSLIRMGIGVHMAAGEMLASVEWLRDGINRPFNTAIQFIDTDRLSNPNGAMDTPFLRGGVVRNIYGAPQGYHVRMSHPGDYTAPDAWRWKYVPIRKPWGRLQMIHIFQQTRPDQTRGVAAMVAALKELRITKRFRDVVLQNAVVNATYAASIESDMPPEAVFQALGGGNIGKSVEQYAGGWLSAINKYAGGSKNMQIDGVKIPHLFPGTKLQLRPAGQGGPLGTEFEQSLLRYISAILGVSYEQLSKDYSNVNYSSLRGAMTETWKYMQSRKRMVADRLASTIYMLWLEEAINAGEITAMSRKRPNYYEGLNAEAYTKCDWIGASKGQIDELKETQAAVLRLKYNLSTFEDECSRLGKDWRTQFRQRERENDEMRERGLANPSDSQDNMMNAASGSARETQSGGAQTGEPADGSEDNTNA